MMKRNQKSKFAGHATTIIAAAVLTLVVLSGRMPKISSEPDLHVLSLNDLVQPYHGSVAQFFETASIRRDAQGVGTHASLALKPQLPVLRSAADRGDTRAACTLAWALELCGRRSQHDRMLDYPDEYLASLDDSQAEKVSRALEFRERRVSAICAGMTPEDAVDVEERLLQSALTGHPESMARFATLSKLPEKYSVFSSAEFSAAYRENAESMLNRAAEAGDLHALSSISFAYSSGSISSALGDLPVKIDRIKAIAATSALIRIRGSGEKEKMPPQHVYVGETGNQTMLQSVREVLKRANQGELTRFAQLESAYIDAYNRHLQASRVAHGLIDDLPEQACARWAIGAGLLRGQ